ncbi:UPF0147 family protein [Hyperthermus butylicus]|uniref:UPF0147 protein Hbut_1631 n=1 Tax=Hyperthermus butylicus (strain DSM 5456 / JCM 9403 / PLM1-5) TaxID=415426 RepID=A2BN84_HYPBU|nr:UPF0147 family protein [Hyperthermus butylicus]ABM81445.1 conserved archaeal protein [Hyperthermus butylicus DSM 5456]
MAAPAYDNEAKIRQAIMILMRIINDTAVPRNIRRAATEAIKQLRDESLSPGVRAANAISILDEISQDPNMPVYARTLIWNVITLLETVRD